MEDDSFQVSAFGNPESPCCQIVAIVYGIFVLSVGLSEFRFTGPIYVFNFVYFLS